MLRYVGISAFMVLLAVVGMIAANFTTEVQTFIVDHPTLATILAGLSVIVSNFLPQPHKTS